MPKYPKRSLRSHLNSLVWWMLKYRFMPLLPLPLSFAVFGIGMVVGALIVWRFVPCP